MKPDPRYMSRSPEELRRLAMVCNIIALASLLVALAVTVTLVATGQA